MGWFGRRTEPGETSDPFAPVAPPATRTPPRNHLVRTEGVLVPSAGGPDGALHVHASGIGTAMGGGFSVRAVIEVAKPTLAPLGRTEVEVCTTGLEVHDVFGRRVLLVHTVTSAGDGVVVAVLVPEGFDPFATTAPPDGAGTDDVDASVLAMACRPGAIVRLVVGGIWPTDPLPQHHEAVHEARGADALRLPESVRAAALHRSVQ
jgi:hypothetical protein